MGAMYAEEKGCSMTQELLRDQQGTEHPVNLGGKDGERGAGERVSGESWGLQRVQGVKSWDSWRPSG